MKKRFYCLAGLALCSLSAATVVATNSFGDASPTVVRDVRVEKSNVDIRDEFDAYEKKDTSKGFIIEAQKKINISDLEFIDTVGQEVNEGELNVEYKVEYVESDRAVFLSAYSIDDDAALIETIAGIITQNEAGETDVVFDVDGELVWLSDLDSEEVIENAGWFRKAFSVIAKGVNHIVSAVVAVATAIVAPVIRLVSVVAVAISPEWAAKIGANVLMMETDSYDESKPNDPEGVIFTEHNTSDEKSAVYHAKFNCWQAYFGYNDGYDFIFASCTSMERKKFEFDLDGDKVAEYMLWAWKGDYINLGAGAELGVYRRLAYSDVFWVPDSSLTYKMELKLSKKDGTLIYERKPKDKQWWITGFAYKYQWMEASNLVAEYTIYAEGAPFETQLRSDLYSNYWKYDNHKWTFTF